MGSGWTGLEPRKKACLGSVQETGDRRGLGCWGAWGLGAAGATGESQAHGRGRHKGGRQEPPGDAAPELGPA